MRKTEQLVHARVASVYSKLRGACWMLECETRKYSLWNGKRKHSSNARDQQCDYPFSSSVAWKRIQTRHAPASMDLNDVAAMLAGREILSSLSLESHWKTVVANRGGSFADTEGCEAKGAPSKDFPCIALRHLSYLCRRDPSPITDLLSLFATNQS